MHLQQDGAVSQNMQALGELLVCDCVVGLPD